MTDTINTKVNRWKNAWLPFVAAIVVLGGAYLLDGTMKNGPFDPVVPEQSTWVISSSDLGVAWSSLETTDIWDKVRKKEGDLFREYVIELRKKVGIRLTPQRINTWLGPRAVVIQFQEDWAIQFRPGLLWKITDPFRGKKVAADQTIKSWAEFWYTDNEGLVTVGSSLKTIQSLRSADTVQLSMPVPQSVDIRLRTDETILDASFAMADSIPVVIEINTLLPKVENELMMPNWPDRTPMMWVAGGSLEGITHLTANLGLHFLTDNHWDHSQMIQSRWSALEQGRGSLLGVYWDQSAFAEAAPRSSALSWYGVDTDNAICVPEWAVQLNYTGHLSEPELPVHADRHVWNNIEGWSVIRDGGVRSLDVVAQKDSTLFFAEQWNTMQRVINDFNVAQKINNKDVAIMVDWKSVSKLYSKMTEIADQHQQLGEQSADEKLNSLNLILKPMAYGDYLWLTGTTHQNRVRLEGVLSHSKPWAEKN